MVLLCLLTKHWSFFPSPGLTGEWDWLRSLKAWRLISPLGSAGSNFLGCLVFCSSLSSRLPLHCSLLSLSTPGVINPHRIWSSITREIVFALYLQIKGKQHSLKAASILALFCWKLFLICICLFLTNLIKKMYYQQSRYYFMNQNQTHKIEIVDVWLDSSTPPSSIMKTFLVVTSLTAVPSQALF